MPLKKYGTSVAPRAAVCDAAILHHRVRGPAGPAVFILRPSTPLSEKNREVTPEEYSSVLNKLGIDPEGPPVILQVSRFDRLKDPVGVVEAFRLVREIRDCRLILAGGSADDDPEGASVLAEVLALTENDPDIKVLSLTPDANLEINVLQRRADVIIQKSFRRDSD